MDDANAQAAPTAEKDQIAAADGIDTAAPAGTEIGFSPVESLADGTVAGRDSEAPAIMAEPAAPSTPRRRPRRKGHATPPPTTPNVSFSSEDAPLPKLAAVQKNPVAAKLVKPRKPGAKSTVKTASPQLQKPSAAQIKPKGAKRMTTVGRPSKLTALAANPSPAKSSLNRKAETPPAHPKIIHAKEIVMDDTPIIDLDFVANLRNKAKTALGKGYAAIGDVGALTKGNVEACVASGNILANGLKELGSSYAADGQAVMATLTSEIKELAAAKSPIDFFRLQGDFLRRNFLSALQFNAKNSQALLNLAKETSAPLAKQANVVIETVRKVA